jgi:hypothetical protein
MTAEQFASMDIRVSEDAITWTAPNNNGVLIALAVLIGLSLIAQALRD